MTTNQNKYINNLLKYVPVALLLIMGFSATAQEQTDSLVVNVGSSKIIFLINDPKDLETLKTYDLNAVLEQLSLKLNGDSTLVSTSEDHEEIISDTTMVVDTSDINRDDSEEEEDKPERSKYRHKGTRNYFNFDIGTNNYLTNGRFPDATDELYTVRPFGSWYVGLSSTYSTHIKGPLFIEWGPSVTWYNFKFQNDKVRVIDGPDGTVFAEESTLTDINFKKSKLTVMYANVSVVPVLAFNQARPSKRKFTKWSDIGSEKDKQPSGFRIGLGGYAGYRILSYSKFVYDDGNKEKDKERDNFNLNNFRYGIRLQMGFGGTDLFFNYDLNDLFTKDKAPQLNAFSFGIIL